MANVIIVVVIIAIVAFVARGYIARGGKGDCCGGDAPVRAKGPADRDASHYAYGYRVKVDGMSCDNCAKRIEAAFNSQPGTMAEVSLAEGTATVRTKQPASADELRRVVRNEGYGAGDVSEL